MPGSDAGAGGGEEMAIAAAPEAAADAAGAGSAPIAGAPAQIAYRYRVAYRLAPAEIGKVQAGHKALCDALGAGRCQMVQMGNRGDSEAASASLELWVEAKLAPTFLADADKAVDAAGGSPTERDVTGEDVAKDISDTAARIAAKQALADRLLALLRERRGSVGDLVEAERAFAQAQEELDAARSWMAQLRQRVAMSNIAITYRASGPSGGNFVREVRGAVDAVGEIVGGSIALLIWVVLALLPWALLLGALFWVKRRMGWRWSPRRWRSLPPAASGDQSAG